MNELILKLFGSVLVSEKADGDFEVDTQNGLVITPSASYAKNDIISFYEKNRLNGDDLNKAFHKSWNKVLSSTREELAVHQIIHYLSTYGGLFGDYIYIPNEKLDVPNLDGAQFLVVNTLTKDEVIKKSLNMLESGIALTQETIGDLVKLLRLLDYTFNDISHIKNKEAMILISDITGVYPEDPVELLRMAVYKATGETLLIKNFKTIEAIKESNQSIVALFRHAGNKKMATIFNRFKPLFLAFKKANRVNAPDINKISKLSKFNHEPLAPNAVNTATHKKIYKKDLHWLENATIFALFKALNALHSRMQGRTHFGYKIRNGKAFFKEQAEQNKNTVWKHNYDLILKEIKLRLKGDDRTVYIPSNIKYAIPTSEKMFLGNIPIGTKIIADQIAAGFYWENEWGARDLDLSGVSINSKIGWNTNFYNSNLVYSGDVTSAPNGAAEYLLSREGGLSEPTLAFKNVYAGEHSGSGFKIIVGEGDNINYDYMFNPNNLVLEAKTETVSRESIIGLFLPEENEQTSFTIFNIGVSYKQVSGYSDSSVLFLKSLVEEYTTQMYLDELLIELGFNVVHEKDKDQVVDFDFSTDKLEKDTFIAFFNNKKN